MKKFYGRTLFGCLWVLGGAALPGATHALSAASAEGGRSAGAPPASSLHLPLHFEPAPITPGGGSDYVVRGGDYGAALQGPGLHLTLPGAGTRPARPAALALDFVGANPRPVMVPEQALPGRSNYFIGSDPSRWRHAVPQFGAVRVRQLYPGVDWLTYHQALISRYMA